MTDTDSAPRSAEELDRSLLGLVAIALVAGAAIGGLGALFRISLTHADGARDALIAWAHGQALVGFCRRRGLRAAAALAAWLVRRFSPHASGSGIPHVEAVLRRASAAGVLHSAAGEVRRRRAGDRIRAGARP